MFARHLDRKQSCLTLFFVIFPVCSKGYNRGLSLIMLWSRRIDETNRLVYEVTDDAVFVVACRYHYSANDRSLLGRR